MDPRAQGYYPGYDEPTFMDKLRNNLAELIEFVAIILVLYVIIHFFVAEPHQVSGSSMVPNFRDQDLIITNKLATRLSTFQRGEVIIFQNPRNASEDYIKRIVGLPGERIRISNNEIFINGTVLDQSFLPAGTITRTKGYMSEGEEILIPNDTYFVMGDNREGSSDSREWGPLKKELIIGQAFLRYWPLSKFELLKINSAYKQS